MVNLNYHLITLNLFFSKLDTHDSNKYMFSICRAGSKYLNYLPIGSRCLITMFGKCKFHKLYFSSSRSTILNTIYSFNRSKTC